MNTNERRSHSRITDIAGVKVSKIVCSMESPEADVEGMAHLLPGLIKKIDRELTSLQPAVQRAQPVLARALDLLNRKLQLSALIQRPQEELDLGEIEVNISSGGIAFSCGEAVEAGTMLGIELKLEGGDQPIRLLARTLSCSTEPGPSSSVKYLLRVEFADADQAHCQRLSDYILKKRVSRGRTEAAVSLADVYSKVSKSSAYSL